MESVLCMGRRPVCGGVVARLDLKYIACSDIHSPDLLQYEMKMLPMV